MKPIMDKPIKEKLQYAKDVLKDSVYERLVGLDMSYALTQEPVPFRERLSLSYAPIREGEVWSNSLWDCGWFHITGDIPQAPAGRTLYFAFDFEGEGCVFSPDGTPLRGITNVSSQFSLGLGFPGKNISVFPKLRRRARRPTFGSKRETTICSEICARAR